MLNPLKTLDMHKLNTLTKVMRYVYIYCGYSTQFVSCAVIGRMLPNRGLAKLTLPIACDDWLKVKEYTTTSVNYCCFNIKPHSQRKDSGGDSGSKLWRPFNKVSIKSPASNKHVFLCVFDARLLTVTFNLFSLVLWVV